MEKTNVIKFFNQIKQEFEKITWPQRKQALLSTVMVFVMVFFMSFYFFVLDLGMSWIVNFLLKL